MSVAAIESTAPPATARRSLTICIYCGAAVGRRKIYEEQTRAAARAIVAAGHRIIYGGAKNGLMGVMADEALKRGGSVVGVLPALLVDKELLHKGLSEIHIVASMHERKKKMSELAEVFLALPGGAGTLEELVEQWTWTQLGIHSKPCGVLDVDEYFAPLRMMVDRMVDEGFLHERHRASLIFSPSIEDVLAGLQQFHMPLAKY
ncbi:MAG TPA: TIGR00730 family Rossman fold protein [Xanthobacteraceae bacterium]|nr:TIGR00730 family Rossman fold protein [Xanthobacteraceae bacterium]